MIPQPTVTRLDIARPEMSPDRYGDTEPIEPHECDNGWIDADADHPRPCVECKPHLAPAMRRATWARQITPPGEPVDWSGRLSRRDRRRGRRA